MILMLITFAGIIIFWVIAKPTPSQLPDVPTLDAGDNPYADLFIPDFKLTDADNKLIEDSYLDGKYTVVDFFYTSCPLICPGMSAAMHDLQEKTKGTKLQFLSITIDPEVDTPEVIKQYSQAFSADPARWKFATGETEMISILLMGMNFELPNLNTDDGTRIIDHPSTLILLGPDRHAIKLYRYSDPDQMDELIKTARKLAS